MCGIIGYSGAEYAREKLLHGLENLEYRGYDSAGIALWDEGKIEVIKAAGRLSNLRAACGDQCLASHCGIGHTRWATHGVPNDVNAHPHRQGRVTLVHNGIIENYRALRERLEREGYHFLTQTDTEIAAALLDHHMKLHESPVAAIHAATAEMEGAYGFCMLLEGEPDTVYGIRRGSPLIAAKDETGSYVASDVPAIIEYTRQYYLLEEEEVVVAHYGELRFYAPDGTPIEKEAKIANWSVEQAQKGGYPCFMQKEIHEQPRALADTIDGRTKDGFVTFEGDGLPDGFFRDVTKLYISACGTAMYSGMVGKAIIEKLARLPVEVEVASELRYRDPIFTPGCAAVVVSQSGETADTLAALRLFKENHIPVIGIVNVVGSSIAREADYCLYTYAGPEIAVASTKAYSVQVAMMYLLGFRIAADGLVPPPAAEAAECCQLPAACIGHGTGIFPVCRGTEKCRASLLPRAGVGLLAGDGGLPEAQGDQLHSLRGLRRRRAEARDYFPDYRRHPGDSIGDPAQDAGQDDKQCEGSKSPWGACAAHYAGRAGSRPRML